MEELVGWELYVFTVSANRYRGLLVDIPSVRKTPT